MTDMSNAAEESATVINWHGFTKIGALEQRVIGVERSIGDIKVDFGSLEIQINELHKDVIAGRNPNWGVLAGWGVVMLMCWGLIISPIQDSIKDIKVSLRDMVPREAHLEKWAETDKQILEIKTELKVLDTAKLSKDEMVDRLANVNAHIQELNSRLDELRRDKAARR